MKYYDLDIRIGSRVEDYYPVNAQSESMGQAERMLPVASVDALRTKVTEFGRAEFSEAALNGLGVSLFDTLFADSIGTLYQRALGQVYADDTAGVRIRLRIQPPEIAALPWEQIYDASRECFLATSKETLLLRYIELSKPIRSLQTALPIRILIVIPEGSGLDVEGEKSKLVDTLASLNSAIETEVLQGKVTSTSISRALVLKQFHILHFIGHGDFRDDAGCLVLNSESDGEDDMVGANQFAYHFQDDPCMKLIVLNSCSGAKSSAGALTGVAQELVRMGVPAVVAMRREVTDEAAKLFAESFYLKLCLGYEPGRVDIAVAHARKELKRALSQNEEFSNPVLFMRSPKGVIFDLGEGTPVTTLPQLHTNNAISGTLDYNIAQMKKQGGVENAEDIAKEVRAQSQVRARIVGFYKRIALAAAPRVVVMGLLLALLVFGASEVKVLNLFRVDDYFDGALRFWANRTYAPVAKDVKILLAKAGNNGGFGDPDASWRVHHGELLKGLADVHPKAVVFDLIFDLPQSEFDPAFKDGITYAQSKGVHVIGSQQLDESGAIIPDTVFTDYLKPAFGDNWGDVEVGVPVELRFFGNARSINAYEVATLKSDNPNDNGQFEVYPSLALRAVMQALADGGTQPQVFFDPLSSEVVLEATSSGSQIQKRIPVSRNHRLLDMVMEYVNKADLNLATDDYKYVYDLTKSSQPQEKDHLQKRFKDAIVFIAYETPADQHIDIDDEMRVGVAFHANAASNILKDAYIPDLSRSLNLLLIAVMVALGILLQTVIKKRIPHSLPLSLPFLRDIIGSIQMPVGLLVVMMVYILVAFFVYSRFRVSFDMSYHLAALLFGYWSVAIFRKQLRLAGAGENSHA